MGCYPAGGGGGVSASSSRAHEAVARRRWRTSEGVGGLLRSVLESRPDVAGMLVDLPHVVESARSQFAESGLLERGRFCGADFFVGVPPGADVYLLKSVLHDWPDEDCVAILRNVRLALRPGARLLVIERLVPANPADAPFVVMQDLHMLAVLGGRERGESEFRDLASASELTWLGATPTETGFYVLEFTREGEV